VLEPCEAKVSRTVLRGLGAGNRAWLLDRREKYYQTVRAIARNLPGRSGAATNRSKPSDNVPISARVASEPRGDDASTSTMW
jgi:hypothetical protein